MDEKFREVIDLLCAFEKDFPSKDPTSGQNICGRTKEGPEANISDKFNSPSTILGVLKQNLHATVTFPSIFISLLLNTDAEP